MTLDAGTATSCDWKGSDSLDFLYAALSTLSTTIVYNPEIGAHVSAEGSLRFSGFEYLIATLGAGVDLLTIYPPLQHRKISKP